MSVHSIRKKILQEMLELQKNWPRIGDYLNTIIIQKLYEQWGFKDFVEYLDQELRIRQSIALQIVDTAVFFKSWVPELYDKVVNSDIPNHDIVIPTMDDVVVLLRFAIKKDIANSLIYKEIVQQVFENVLCGKSIAERLAEITYQGGLGEIRQAPQYSLNSPSETQMPTINILKQAPRRTVWDNVNDSRVIKINNSQRITQSVENPDVVAPGIQEGCASEVVVGDSQANYIDCDNETTGATEPVANHQKISPSKVPNSIDKQDAQDKREPPLQQALEAKKEEQVVEKVQLNSDVSLPIKNHRTQPILKILSGLPFWFWTMMLALFVSVLLGVYLHQDWQNKKLAQKMQDYMSQAEHHEKNKNWNESILYYRRANGFANQNQQMEIIHRITTIESRLAHWNELRKEFLTVFGQAEIADGLKNYHRAWELYEQAQNIYQRDPEYLNQDKFIREAAKKLAFKITSNRSSYEILMNKNISFRDAYIIAEKAVEQGKWKEAYHAYQRAYEIDSSYNPELEKKIREVEEKSKKIEDDEFQVAQIRKGLIYYQDKWITYEQKMEMDGFKKYQNQWVDGKLYLELKDEEERIRVQIQYIEALLQERRIYHRKLYSLETKEGKKYRGEVMEKNSSSITVKIVFSNGSMERKFTNNEIKNLQLEDDRYEYFFENFKSVQSISDIFAMLKWGKEKKIQEIVQLAHYRLFLLDFSYPGFHRIPMLQKDGVWYKQ